ncbi:MAG: MarR family transcriptional regulator [Acetobacteraceae bacterium]|nr:MarR family transcriptional regulator [Acetobacteraceae bacterium]
MPVRSLYLLRQAQLAAHAKLDAELSPLGITPTQYAVLSLAARRRVPRSSAELARRAGVSAQAMAEMVAGLEAKGLIRREESPENRRVLHIRLTRRGTQLLRRCDAAADAAESAVFAALSSAERLALDAMLRRIAGLPEQRADAAD